MTWWSEEEMACAASESEMGAPGAEVSPEGLPEAPDDEGALWSSSS